MAQSKLFFEQALAKDPGYVLALTGLADQYSIDGFYGYIPSLEAAARARKYLKHALTFDDSLSEAHNANAFVQGFFNHAWSEAARAARRAVELSPANVIALVWGALVLAIVGDAEESVEWLERAHLLDPLSPYVGGLSACALLLLFRDSEALKQVDPFLASHLEHPVVLAPFTVGEGTHPIAKEALTTHSWSDAPFGMQVSTAQRLSATQQQ